MLDGFAADSDRLAVPGTPEHDLRAGRARIQRAGVRALGQATGTSDEDWAFPTQPGLEMRAGPQPNAPVVEKLGMHFVRVMEDDKAPANQDQPMLGWWRRPARSASFRRTPSARSGNDQICYVKEAGAWKIAGFIGGDQ